ncbi:MAG: hypothetical protein MUF87_17820 [Anaerolineae bacterium]|jgi:uncharacterized membrane protein YczE|nr:hypothetical protein [Anaerolineae bacterium]
MMKLLDRLPLLLLIGFIWGVILALEYFWLSNFLSLTLRYDFLLYRSIGFVIGMILIDIGIRLYLKRFTAASRRDRIKRLLSNLDDRDLDLLREQLEHEPDETTSLEHLLNQKRKNLS